MVHSAGTTLNGRYHLVRSIGRGGFAQVFLATDLILQRRVAAKLLLPQPSISLNWGEFLDQFTNEARAIAALDHPNILPIHDFGHVDDTAYLIMPFVSGGTLADKLRADGPLAPPGAVAIMRQIASALDYAHHQGVVHRDLKPNNFLVRDDNHILLADFGIAKVLSSTSAVTYTRMIGTPAYMAPEQFRGMVSQASDIYSLGCVLFELLTGKPPYTGIPEELMYGHVMGDIPSIAERSSGRVTPAVQAVINCALAKEPAQRFPSAVALVEAYESAIAPEEPVSAGRAAPACSASPTISAMSTSMQRPPANSQTRSTTRRKFLTFGIGSLVLVTFGGGVGAAVGMHRAGAARGTSATTPILSLKGAAASSATATQALPTMLPSVTSTTVVAMPTDLPPTPAPTRTPTATLTPTVAVPRRTVATIAGQSGGVSCISWSPKQPVFATGCRDASVRLWRSDGSPVRALLGHLSGLRTVAWSPDGTLLASGSEAVSSGDGRLRLWSPEGQTVAVLSGHSNVITSLAWSPDSAYLASGSGDQTVRIWTRAGQSLATLSGHTGFVNGVAWSPDGKLVASVSTDRTVRLWQLDGTEVGQLRGHTTRITAVTWSPDGMVVSGADDATIRFWLREGTTQNIVLGHRGTVTFLSWSPDGRYLASSSLDQTARIWSAAGQPLAILSGHSGGVNGVSWSSDSVLIATGSDDETARVWR